MKQQNAQIGRRMPLWFLISGALWLALTVALQFAGGAEPAYAQQNSPDPTPNVEATQTPTPSPSPSACPYTP